MIDDLPSRAPKSSISGWTDVSPISGRPISKHAKSAGPPRRKLREVVTQLRALPRMAPGRRVRRRVMARVGSRRRRPSDRRGSGPLGGGTCCPVERRELISAAVPSARAWPTRSGCWSCVWRRCRCSIRAPGFADRVMDQVDLPVTSVAGAWRLWRGRFARNPLGGRHRRRRRRSARVDPSPPAPRGPRAIRRLISRRRHLADDPGPAAGSGRASAA